MEMVDRRAAQLYAEWFRCLADPNRILILNLLARERRPMKVGEIVERVDIGQSTVSHHLKRLAETGFVLVERVGTASWFRINERCVSCFPSAADVVMGRVEPSATVGHLPAPGPVHVLATGEEDGR